MGRADTQANREWLPIKYAKVKDAHGINAIMMAAMASSDQVLMTLIADIFLSQNCNFQEINEFQKTLGKLPKNLRGSEVTEVRRRLEAIGNAQQSMPIPKGPMPTSPRQVRRQRR